MNKLCKILFYSLIAAGCTANDTDRANALLDEARQAASVNSFDKARELVDSLRNTYPNEIDVRKAALVFMDTLELQQAKQDLHVSDSVLTYKQFELDDLKKDFSLEKQPKYQTTGYYVTNDYAGSKSAFSYFTEVEEVGALLAVTISRSSGIRYDFTPVEVDLTTDKIPACPISRSLSEKEQMSYEKCYNLARCMQQLSEAKAAKEKFELKVRFFEKKISEDKDVLSAE